MSFADIAYSILIEANPMNISKIAKQFSRRDSGNFLRTTRGQFAGSKSLMSKRLAEKARPKTVYIASPLGFPKAIDESKMSAAKRFKLKADLESKVKKLGHKVLDPWRHDYGPEIGGAFGNKSWAGQRQQFDKISKKIGGANERDLKDADTILAVHHKAPHVSGDEIDAGTVWETGHMRGQGKQVHIYRDAGLKDVGDFPGQPVNLQAKYGARRVYRKTKDINF